jgi:hypothetical protein
MFTPSVQFVSMVQMTPRTWRSHPKLISTDQEIESQLGKLLLWSLGILHTHKYPRDSFSLGILAENVPETLSAKTDLVSQDGPHMV